VAAPEHLSVPSEFMADVQKLFTSLPRLRSAGKIILTFELSCGPGGTLNDIECKHFVQRKWSKS